MNNCVIEGESLLVKLDQLLCCTERYNDLYEDVRRALEGEYEQKLIEIKNKSYKINQLIREGEEGKKVQLYKENEENYKNTNENVLDIANDYFTFKQFSDEFENALVLVGGVHNLRRKAKLMREDDTNLSQSRSFDNAITLQGNLRTFTIELKNKLNESMDMLFSWR